MDKRKPGRPATKDKAEKTNSWLNPKTGEPKIDEATGLPKEPKPAKDKAAAQNETYIDPVDGGVREASEKPLETDRVKATKGVPKLESQGSSLPSVPKSPRRGVDVYPDEAITEGGKAKAQADAESETREQEQIIPAKGRPDGTEPSDPPTASYTALHTHGPGRLPTEGKAGNALQKEHLNANPEQLLTQQGARPPVPEYWPEDSGEYLRAEAERLWFERQLASEKESEDGERASFRKDPMLKKTLDENRRYIAELSEEGHVKRVEAMKLSDEGEQAYLKKVPLAAKVNAENLQIRRDAELLWNKQIQEAQKVSSQGVGPYEAHRRPEAEDMAVAAATKPKMIEVLLKRKYAPVSWENESGEMQSQKGEVVETLPEGTVVKVAEKEAQRILHLNGIAVPTSRTFA